MALTEGGIRAAMEAVPTHIDITAVAFREIYHLAFQHALKRLGKPIHELGYLFALVPAGTDAVLMLAVGLLVTNLPRSRRYPQFWW